MWEKTDFKKCIGGGRVMDKKRKNLIKITILTLSLVQMATNGLSPAMADIAQTFSDASVSKVQLLMTLPGIFVVILSLTAAWLTTRFSKKMLIGTGSLCVCLSGILGFLFHQKLGIMFIWSALLGIGMGLVSALTASMISDFFEGKEKAALMGMQTGAGNVGAMLMTAIGGMLTMISWEYNYLVFLIGLPGLILLLCVIPSGRNLHGKGLKHTNIKEAADKVRGTTSKTTQTHLRNVFQSSKVWLYAAMAFVFLFLFNVLPTNLAMYVAEAKLGTAAVSGWAAAALLFGGTVMSVFFGKITGVIGTKTVPVGFILLAIGAALLNFSGNLVTLFAGCFIAGTSISMVMPQCMLQASMSGKPEQIAMSTAIVMAASNLGTFLTPVITNLAAAISGSGAVYFRYVTSITLAVVGAGIIFVCQMVFGKKKKIE